MAQVVALPGGFVGAPGRHIGESLGEKITRPIHEGGTIANRGDVHHVTVLVYQLVQYEQAAALVWGRHSRDRGPPGPVHDASVDDEFRISQCGLVGPRAKIVERSHLLQISAQIAVVTVVDWLKRFP